MRILFINPFGIGDVLFTTPAVRAIKEAHPESFIGYWCNLRVKDLLTSNPRINKVFALSRGDIKKLYKESFFKGLVSSLKLIFEIKKERFDICLDFSLDHRYGLAAKIVGIKRRIGFNYKQRGRLLTDKIDITGYHDKHVVEYYLDLLKFLNIEAKEKNLEVFILPQIQELADKILKEKANLRENDLVVGIAPGAGGSWGKDAFYKHWPAERFAYVADRLIEDFGAKVILLGDESEIVIRDEILRKMHHRLIDLVGEINLEVLPAIIKRCHIFLSNDGGPMHIAVGLGVKTVTVMGPTSEVVYGPYPLSEKNVVVTCKGECRPCYKNFRLPACNNDLACLKMVDEDEVYINSIKLLNDSN